ncbi:MAG: Na/Pi cotransporter family protein [Acholeplasmatales bacterium]|nr:Na/Pi cotransporter family protein [Acholeplasmatales bacterium]
MDIVKQVIYLLVGLVVFVTGMNFMSNGLKTCAGRSIRRLFKKIKDNRIASAAVGAGTTAIIQSSGATTVLVVGFLSAGALTFSQGFSVMLGAFLGTTVTGLLVALSSFSFSIFLMSLAFVGFIFGFFKNENIKSVGEILVGFGILFFGLEAMKGAFALESIQNALVTLLSAIDFPLLLMLFGALLTALTQSSSATNGIVIVMVASNPNLLSSGFYLVLGATIGSLLPTLLASIKSNILAKRVTYSAIITRTLGALIATIVIWTISTPLFNWLSDFPSENVGMILAIFTVVYNFIFLVLFLPLTPIVEKVANKVFKDHDALRKKKVLQHIDDNLLNTPAIAIIQVKREIETMLELSKINFSLGMDAIININLANTKDIESREEKIDVFNEAISQYLIKLSPKANMRDEKKIGSYYHVINDIERIGDHANNFLQMAKQMSGLDLKFSDIAKSEFETYEKVVDEMFELSANIFEKRSKAELDKLHILEEKTDSLRELYERNHFERLKNNECLNELSPFHSNLLSELERVADHLTNIGYSIISPTGDENDYLSLQEK